MKCIFNGFLDNCVVIVQANGPVRGLSVGIEPCGTSTAQNFHLNDDGWGRPNTILYGPTSDDMCLDIHGWDVWHDICLAHA